MIQSATNRVPRSDLLGVYAEAEQNQQEMYIGHLILPDFGVPEPSGDFYRDPVEGILADPGDIRRRPGSNYKSDTHELSRSVWLLDDFGFENFVDRRQLRFYRSVFDAEAAGTRKVQRRVAMAKEMEVAKAMTSTSTWAQVAQASFNPSRDRGLILTEELDDDNCDIFAVFELMRNAVEEKIGLPPNVLWLTRRQQDAISRHPDVIDRVKYRDDSVRRVRLRPERLAELFDVDTVLIAGGVKNTGAPGSAAALSKIWSNEYFGMARVASTPDLSTPHVGRTFRLDGDEGVGAESWVENRPPGTWVRAYEYRQINLFDPQAAVLASNAITTP